MASTRSEPCNWALAFCGEGSANDPNNCASLASLSPAVQDLIQRAAVSYLWNWTRRQFGTCPITIRPCRDTCIEAWATYRGRGAQNFYLPYTTGSEGYSGPFTPALINGQWYNFGCGGSCNTDLCSCTYVPTITLAGPVADVTQVKLGGVVLDPSKYRLDNHMYLVRTDGSDWPVCQNMVEDPSVVGSNTFTVTYDLGVTPPAGGQIAAGVLACQFAKAACNDKTCQLPQRIQTITRQGVTTLMLDSFHMLYETGTTGLFMVDNWVASILASNKVSGMRIGTPDRRPPRRTT